MDFIRNWFEEFGVPTVTAEYLAAILMVILIAGVCWLGYWLTKVIVLKLAARFIARTKFTWDDILLNKKVFHKQAHIVPAIMLYYFSNLFPDYQFWIEKAASTYLFIVGIVVLNVLLNACDEIYRSFEMSKLRPIKGYIQVVKIVVFLVGGILVIANLIGQSPVILLSGLGALSAVLMLIFKDSILGLVAGVQLTSNDMVRVGDWIEMPKYNADGDVIDISLNTVKVMNFDKTITTIPSYALISDSFRNWRGMQTAGGRRIKRSVYIDMSSIAFCNQESIEKFQKIQYLSAYVSGKKREIDEYNEVNGIDKSSQVNGRQLTNIGVFRAYILHYLKHHPKIHKEMTLLVRQLLPGENGLPLEMYAFTNETNWAIYESIQSDIFDHILAVAPEFGLRIFQNPTGHDLQRTMEFVSS